MAGIGAGGVSKAVGEAIFGQPKLQTIYGNQKLAEIQTADYPELLRSLMGTGKKAATDYSEALALGTPEATRLQADDIANYSKLLTSGSSFNPLDYFDHSIEAKTNGPGGLRSFLPDFSGLVNNAVSRRGFNAGLNGTGNSAYNTRVATSEMGSQLAPILRDIYNSAGRDTETLSGSRLSNIGNMVGLMNNRSGIPDRLANRAMLPYNNELGIVGNQFSLGQLLGDTTKANIQGHELKSNPWANLIGSIGSSIDQTVDTAGDWADRALSAYSGGMIGGGAKSGGGGGGGGGPVGGFGGFDGAGNSVTNRYAPGPWDVPPPQSYAPSPYAKYDGWDERPLYGPGYSEGPLYGPQNQDFGGYKFDNNFSW